MRSSIAAMTCGTHSPPGSSAVFHAVASTLLVDSPVSEAETTSPALFRHRETPVYAAKTTGRTTPSRSASR